MLISSTVLNFALNIHNFFCNPLGILIFFQFFRKYKFTYAIIQYSNSVRYKYKYYNIIYIVYEKFSLQKLIQCIQYIIILTF